MTATKPPPILPESRPYRPRGAAREILYRKDGEILISGSAGTGKSRACLEKVHLCAQKYAGMRGLIVRKTRESLTESALVTFEEKVVPPRSPILEGTQRRMRQSYRYPNGSELVIGGLDKPSKVMSTEYDLIYVQEAIELFENDWESLSTRLRNGVMPYQQLLADTNPDSPHHWLYQRCQGGRTLMLESRHEDNPRLWDERKGEWTPEGAVYIARLDALTGARLPRLRHGRWVQAEGVVYPEWDRAVHLIDRFEIPEDWRRFRVCDFGYINPCSVGWYALDGDDRLYLYRQHYRTGWTVRRHAEEIHRLSAGETFEATVCDHDAEDRATLEECGIPTVPAWKDVTMGIQGVQDRLKKSGDGKPRLFVFRDALVERDPALDEAKKPCGIVEEIDGYVWPKAADGRAVKEAPVKVNDHALDECRYACAYADGKGFRWIEVL